MQDGRLKHQFRPKQHLKRGGDFSRLKLHGRRLTTTMFITNWMPRDAGSCSRLGVVTGKRLGNAVVRNRARRVLREAFRLLQHQLATPIDLVLVARNGVARKTSVQVQRDLAAVLSKAGLLRPPASGSSTPGTPS